MRVGERMACVDQFHQPCSVDMGVNLGGGDVGVTKQGLQNPEIGAPGEQVCGEGMPKHVRADPFWRDPCVSGHLTNQLEEPHPA